MDTPSADATPNTTEAAAAAFVQRRTNRYPRGRFFMKENTSGSRYQHPLEIGGIHSVRKPRKDYDWLGIYAAKRGWTE